MFARTAVMRFRATRIAMGVSPYALFLKQTKGSISLLGLSATQRAKALGKQWRALPAAQKAEFVRKAKTHPAFPKRVRKARKAGPFAKFIQANYKSVKSLPFNQRLAALAKKFKAAKN